MLPGDSNSGIAGSGLQNPSSHHFLKEGMCAGVPSSYLLQGAGKQEVMA